MKKFLYLLLILCLITVSTASFTQQAETKLKVIEKIEIQMLPQIVWSRIKNFNGLPNWHPAFVDSKMEGENKPGAMRTLTLKSGDQILEKLVAYDEEKMSFSYSIEKVDTKAVPVTDYLATMTVKPGEGYNSIVEWEGHFNAPPGVKEEDSIQVITDVYVSGLKNLKKILEKKY